MLRRLIVRFISALSILYARCCVRDIVRVVKWGIEGFLWCVYSGLDESYGVIAKVALVFFDTFMLMKIIIHDAFLP